MKNFILPREALDVEQLPYQGSIKDAKILSTTLPTEPAPTYQSVPRNQALILAVKLDGGDRVTYVIYSLPYYNFLVRDRSIFDLPGDLKVVACTWVVADKIDTFTAANVDSHLMPERFQCQP